ncbi:site-specific integrase [Clostridium sp. E02]|uniref:tyrosine-type recombinase/integrase n=1 Tax=Clostridium sp. E02 TaxID=2487134 RepID=UPI000F53CA6B|nr:site-specific integrase [Clostridium sp. E02]
MAEKRKKRKDGRYAKQVTIGIKNGKSIRKTLYGDTLKELDKNYRDFMSLKDKGIILQEENITFQELSDLWLANEKVGRIKDQSIHVIKSQLRSINDLVGNIKVKDLRQSHIEAFRRTYIKMGKTARYNQCLITIRAIMRYAVRKDIVARDVTEGLLKAKHEVKTKRSLTNAERDLIDKAAFNKFERCFVSLLLYTGLRKSEALALNLSDLDFTHKKINVCKTLITSKKVNNCLQDNTKTKAGKRQVPIPSPLLPILEEYASDRKGILFPSRTGDYIGNGSMCNHWSNILKKLQAVSNTPLAEDITPHTFRHTYASDLYKSGIDIKQAQYLLGHDDIKTTLDTYTHFGYADVKVDKLESYYNAVKMQSNENIIPLKHA